MLTRRVGYKRAKRKRVGLGETSLARSKKKNSQQKDKRLWTEYPLWEVYRMIKTFGSPSENVVLEVTLRQIAASYYLQCCLMFS